MEDILTNAQIEEIGTNIAKMLADERRSQANEERTKEMHDVLLKKDQLQIRKLERDEQKVQAETGKIQTETGKIQVETQRVLDDNTLAKELGNIAIFDAKSELTHKQRMRDLEYDAKKQQLEKAKTEERD